MLRVTFADEQTGGEVFSQIVGVVVVTTARDGTSKTLIRKDLNDRTHPRGVTVAPHENPLARGVKLGNGAVQGNRGLVFSVSWQS